MIEIYYVSQITRSVRLRIKRQSMKNRTHQIVRKKIGKIFVEYFIFSKDRRGAD